MIQSILTEFILVEDILDIVLGYALPTLYYLINKHLDYCCDRIQEEYSLREQDILYDMIIGLKTELKSGPSDLYIGNEDKRVYIKCGSKVYCTFESYEPPICRCPVKCILNCDCICKFNCYGRTKFNKKTVSRKRKWLNKISQLRVDLYSWNSKLLTDEQEQEEHEEKVTYKILDEFINRIVYGSGHGLFFPHLHDNE